MLTVRKASRQTFRVVQWLRNCLPVQVMGSIPAQGTKVPHAKRQLSPNTRDY